MAKTYLKLFYTSLFNIEGLTYEERGRLFTALITYGSTGKMIPLPGNERFVFPAFKINIDLENESYLKKVDRLNANKQKGTGNQERKSSVHTDSEPAVNSASEISSEVYYDITPVISADICRHQDTYQDRRHLPLKEEDKDKDKDKDNLSLKESVKRKDAPRFSPPTIQEIEDYCHEAGLQTDPQVFFDYYASNGWMVSKNHMQDWQAALRRWDRNRFPYAAGTGGKKRGEPFPSSFDTDDFFEAALAKSYSEAERISESDT